MTAVAQGRQMCGALVEDINNGRVMFDEFAANAKKLLEVYSYSHLEK